MIKRTAFIMFFLVLISLTFTGCLSHWFIETESRLQVENATKNYTILSVGVISEDGFLYSPWIEDKILPGERSRVKEGDWVGEFKIRVSYILSNEFSDTLIDNRILDLEGGSMYMLIESSEDSLIYKFR